MTAVKRVIEDVLNNFDHENKPGLARKLANALTVEGGHSLGDLVQDVLDRELSEEELFKLQTLEMLLDEQDMGGPDPDDSAKGGGF